MCSHLRWASRTSKRRRGEKFLESTFSNFQKHKHISNLIGFGRKLAGILDRLEPLSERHGFMKFLNNVEHANALNGFVKELSLAITDYQVCGVNSAEQVS